MSGPSFVAQPDPELPLYFMNPPPPPGVPGYQVGYWATSLPWPTVPLSLTDSWSNAKGVYLFLNTTPTDLADFADQLRQLLNDPSFVNSRFLWLANPDAQFPQWNVQALAASQPEGFVDPPADLTFRNYHLSIGVGSTVALAPSQDGFSITPPADSEAIAFRVIDGARYPLTGGGGAPNLPMTGPTIGCLAFALTTDQPDFFAAVDSGVRYFMKDPVQPRFKRVKSLQYPVFAGAPGQTLAAVLDPANPLSYERSFLGFPPAGPAIASRFTTNYGNPLTLAPTFSTFAPCGPRLAFAARPRKQDGDPEADYYLAPAGSFTVATKVNEAAPSAAGGFTPPATRVMCGAAGIEYLGLTSPTGSLLHFFPNQPAYAPSLGDAPPETEAAARALAPKANDDGLLTDYASTSWLYATPPPASSVVYFAQPNDAALYGATASEYLQFLEVPAGTFQTTGFAAAGAVTPAFPMVPYTGVEAATVTDYAEMEAKILSPLRRDLVGRLTTTAPPAAAAARLAEPPVSGATPQGLLVELDDSRTQWLTLTIAQLADNALRLHDVRGGFKEALQTNQLFAVLSDPSVVLSAAGLEYEITEVVIKDLASKVDPVPTPVLDKLRPMLGTVYPDDPAFQTALKAALGTDDYDQYGAVVTRYAARFDLEVEDWRFRLSPTMWTANPAAQTICLFKYANRPLQALAEDVSTWSWLPAAGNAAETQARLLKILNDAAAVVDASGGVPNDLDYFVKVVMRNPAWNGILFLNANVPLSTLPPDLSGLVSGIKPERFYGHHFGVEITPVEPGQTLTLGDSSLFGLILYDDPEDLAFNGNLYDFKVLLLKVLFSNSTITGFASRIELMTNAYFGDRGNLAASEHGNNLILDGSRQLQGETATYVYLQEGSNVFVMRSNVLREVEITKTQFVTLVPASGPVTDVSSASRFLLWGRIRFDALPGFDVFSFGPTLSPDNVVIKDGFLPFANLSVDMASDGTAGGTKTFTFNPNDITFDAAAAETRADSLYAHFPLVVTGLLRGRRGTKLADLGYVPVKTPLNVGPLTDDWYALAFQLDLGTLGALAGQLGFVVALAAAWSPGENSTNAMVALRLPGGRSLTSVIPIQGVIKLGFNSIDFTASPAGAGVSYQLLFKKFALQLLSFSFPPGQADLSFFGNPNNTDRSSIGWYAAYLKGK